MRILRIIVVMVCFSFISNLAFSDVDSFLEIREEDGSPSTYPYSLRVSNGTLTDNGDGTASLSISGGGGSGLWEVDINGDLEPITDSLSDNYWELDINDDLQPKTA